MLARRWIEAEKIEGQYGLVKHVEGTRSKVGPYYPPSCGLRRMPESVEKRLIGRRNDFEVPINSKHLAACNENSRSDANSLRTFSAPTLMLLGVGGTPRW